MIQLHNGDCMEAMKLMKDKSVDMIFADPPFNVGKKYNTYNDNRDDYYHWQDEWIKEGFRLLKDTGVFYLMTIDRNLPETLHSMSKHGKIINLIKWKNVSANHSKRTFCQSSQPIAMYSKSDNYTFNTYAQTRDTFKSWDKDREGRAKGQLMDYWDDIPLVYAGSIIHKEAILKKGTKQKLHLAQMPIDLVGRAVLFSTNEGDVVLDPFSGIGTTAVACDILNREFIGYEIDKDYFEAAQKRLKQHQSQLSLHL